MSWSNAVSAAPPEPVFSRPAFSLSKIDWAHLVTLDFESYYDVDYTLRKLSTSEYIRDPRFKAHMVGIKIGKRKTKVVPTAKIGAILKTIDWSTHDLLAHNCLPGDVEVLTLNGWVAIKDAPADGEIMQWCPETQALTWVKPSRKIESVSKTLLGWDTNLHSCAYTPEHRMYFTTPDRADWRVATAQELSEKSQNNVYLPISGIHNPAESLDLSVNEACLMEAIRADGSWMTQGGTCYGAQFKFKKVAKQERLRTLAAALDLDLVESQEGREGILRMRFNVSDTIRKLFDFLAAEKQYGLWVLNLSLAARLAILEEARHWDGSKAKADTSYAWSCANEKTVEAFQLLAHTAGWSMSGNWRANDRGFNEGNIGAKLYVANVSQKARAKLVEAPTEREHNAAVYCFTVPTGAFLIRSNDRVLITGNCAFDGLILSHHYGVVPRIYYDTLSMARGLFSNDIGASLDEVAQFLGLGNKIPNVLEQSKGVLDLPKALYFDMAEYCAQDVDLCLAIFTKMLETYPASEIKLIDMTIRMFCDPILKIDIPRVEIELAREIKYREDLMESIVDPGKYVVKDLLKTTKERALEGKERLMLQIKRIIGSDEKFAALLRAEGVEPPVKISPAWMKKPSSERTDEGKWAYAFAKDDADFNNLPEMHEEWAPELNLNHKKDMAKLLIKQERIRNLVECRQAVKSTTNLTRSERFLKAGADGMSLPVGYAYYRAHTGRFGGNNKMNMQNLTRGGELRLSILAPKGFQIVVGDSGQIECRVNGWLWEQDDLMEAFRQADAGTGRDAYCNFADHVYGREINKVDKMERFVGKVCVLGLGFQMGAPKFQMTLAKGALGGPPVFFDGDRCKAIVNTYRRQNYKIVAGWEICKRIIEDMATGRTGSHKCISWEKERIWLPNGMCLKYPDLKQKTGDKGWDEWSYQSKNMRKKIYGGLLCENLVQALARIIVMDQMVDVGDKYRVVMSTHDEISLLARTRSAPTAYKALTKIMCTPPAWCRDLPMTSEGGFDVNYSK